MEPRPSQLLESQRLCISKHTNNTVAFCDHARIHRLRFKYIHWIKNKYGKPELCYDTGESADGWYEDQQYSNAGQADYYTDAAEGTCDQSSYHDNANYVAEGGNYESYGQSEYYTDTQNDFKPVSDYPNYSSSTGSQHHDNSWQNQTEHGNQNAWQHNKSARNNSWENNANVGQNEWDSNAYDSQNAWESNANVSQNEWENNTDTKKGQFSRGQFDSVKNYNQGRGRGENYNQGRGRGENYNQGRGRGVRGGCDARGGRGRAQFQRGNPRFQNQQQPQNQPRFNKQNQPWSQGQQRGTNQPRFPNQHQARFPNQHQTRFPNPNTQNTEHVGQFGASFTEHKTSLTAEVVESGTGNSQTKSSTNITKVQTSAGSSEAPTSTSDKSSPVKAGSSTKPASGETTESQLGTSEEVTKPGTSKEVKEPGTSKEVKEPGTSEEVNEDSDSDSSDEDTDYCKYCKLNFKTPKGFHEHTRGIQHATLYMAAKAEKGDKKYQKEIVAPEVLEVHIPAPKPAEPETVDTDDKYGIEDNWMNLDDDVIKYMREQKDVHNRDLNPEDIGKMPVSDEFSCPLCEIKCTGAQAFKMHIGGKQHNNKLELAEKGVKVRKKKAAVLGVMVESKDKPAKILEMIEKCDQPLIGLDFVSEFQKADYRAPPRYVCNLCESKCDGATIIPHVIGYKHRTNYFKQKCPSTYEHLMKYNSKKKKSEMNTSCEMFAREVQEEHGMGEVKVKVEVEAIGDENDLKETMIRHSQALIEKVQSLEEINPSDASEIKMEEFRNKQAEKRSAVAAPAGRGARRGWGLGRGAPRGHYHDDYDYDEPYYKMPRYGYDDRDPYYDRLDPYSRRDHDFRSAYWDRFDPYRQPEDDPYYSRRLSDERRRLDDLMLERHHISDPYAEKSRVSDILERRRYLDELERRRLDDILERRRLIDRRRPGEDRDNVQDVDMLRLKRFEERELKLNLTSGSPSTRGDGSSPSVTSAEKTRLEDQIARRQALDVVSHSSLQVSSADRSRLDDVLARRQALESQSRVEMSKPQSTSAERPQSRSTERGQVMSARIPNLTSSERQQLTAAEQKQLDELIAARRKALAASKPEPRVTSETQNTAVVDDAEKLRLLAEAVKEVMEKNPEMSLPGLGSSSTSKKVPSFLRTPNLSTQSPVQAHNTTHQAGLALKTSTWSAESKTSLSQFINPQQPTAATQAVAKQKTAVNTTNIDQPQQLLLESIRLQTELIRKSLASVAGKTTAAKTKAQSTTARSAHVPNSTNAQPASAANYSQVAPSIVSAPPSATSAANKATPTSSHVTSQVTTSGYSSHYYQQNFHMSTPNAAPQQAPPPSNPIPSPSNQVPPTSNPVPPPSTGYQVPTQYYPGYQAYNQSVATSLHQSYPQHNPAPQSAAPVNYYYMVQPPLPEAPPLPGYDYSAPPLPPSTKR